MSTSELAWKFIISRQDFKALMDSIKLDALFIPVFGEYNYDLEIDYDEEMFEHSSKRLDQLYHLVNTDDRSDKDYIYLYNFGTIILYKSLRIHISVSIDDNIEFMRPPSYLLLASVGVNKSEDSSIDEHSDFTLLLNFIGKFNPLIAWPSKDISVSRARLPRRYYSDYDYAILSSCTAGVTYFKRDVWNDINIDLRQSFLEMGIRYGLLQINETETGICLNVIQNEDRLNELRDLNFGVYDLTFEGLKALKIR